MNNSLQNNSENQKRGSPSCKSMNGKKKSRVAFDIPGFHESVKRDYENGEITLEQAAVEFYQNNWTPYIDYAYTREKLGISEVVEEIKF